MAIGTVVWGAVSAISGGGTNLTPGYPATPSGLLLCFCYTRENKANVFSQPSGWSTLVGTTATANGSYAIFYKAATGSESGTLTVTNTTSTNASALARMCKVPGAMTSSFSDATPTAETESAASPVTNAGITTGTNGSLVVLFTGKGDGGNGTTDDYASWSGNSLTWAGVANGTTSGTDAAIGIGTAVKATAGATSTLSVNNTLTFVGISYAFAVKAAVPVTYNESLTEASSAADTLAPATTFVATLTEASSAADALVPAATINATYTESATATDGLVPEVTFNDSLTETVTSLDDLVGGLVLDYTISEDVAAADVIEIALAVNAALTEPATAGDALTASVAFVTALSEAASLTDALNDTLVIGSKLSLPIKSAVTGDTFQFKVWSGVSWT